MVSNWIKTDWTKETLDHKKVEFRITTDTAIVWGVGELWVKRNPEGLLALEVVTDDQGENWTQRIQRRFPLTPAAVQRLEVHPDQAVAHFRLFDTPSP